MPGASGEMLDSVIELFQPSIRIVRTQQEFERRVVRSNPSGEDGLPDEWSGSIRIGREEGSKGD
jgi:hypothetical protein